MRFGPNSCKVTIRRRAVLAGAARGDFANAGIVWCSWRASGAKHLANGGIVEDATQLTLRINDAAFNRSVNLADRLVFRGFEHRIVSVAPPDRTGGFIELVISREAGG